ncbi:MAG: ribosome recycling factor [Bernardetiaceae bacterium]
MEEDIQIYLDAAREGMESAIEYTQKVFAKIRAGRANPIMLESVSVNYYGTFTPLQQTAGITTPDARTLMVKPWEKAMLTEIEKAITNANLGFNPQNDGNVIRISVPPLSEERRREFVKKAREEAENGKIGVRNARKEANEGLRDLQKDGVAEDAIKRAEEQVQQLTNDYTKKIDELFAAKEKEIMTV